MAFVRTAAATFFAAMLFLSPILRWAKWAIGTGGDFDFVVSRSRDPDWLSSAVQWLISPPDWVLAPMIAAGLAIVGLNSWYSRQQFLQRIRDALEKGLLDNPERIKGRPSYLRLERSLHPETGNRSPGDKVKDGKIEFENLCKIAFKNDDYEAYLTANFSAQWLHTNAKFYYGSTEEFQKIAGLIDEKMEELHNNFALKSFSKRNLQ